MGLFVAGGSRLNRVTSAQSGAVGTLSRSRHASADLRRAPSVVEINGNSPYVSLLTSTTGSSRLRPGLLASNIRDGWGVTVPVEVGP